jgi:NADH:ubiquinone oxidoreductase subunit 6 (subunit J)
MSARRRTILVWVLLVLGTVVVLVGSLTVWVKRQGLDTDSWVNTSSKLLEDDDVRGALSIYIVDELYANLDPEETLEDQLPENLQGLAGPIAGALRQPAVEGVDRFLQRPRVQDLWERANRAAHEALLRVLNDETRAGISTAGGVVTLDLRTLLVSIGEELGFGERLDSRLPETAGQITILQSDQLEAAQTGVKILKVLSWLIILIAIALFAGAVWLARRRRETLRNVGAALLLVGIVLLVIRRVVGNYIVDALSSGESVRDAVGSTWIIGTDLLAEVAWALIIYGLVILIGTVLAGPFRYARRAREALAPNFRERPEFGWAALAGLYLLLILWGPVPALRNWLGVIVLGALIALGFEAFRRVVLAEAGPGDTERLPPPPPAPAA